ncbi:putative membrane protein [Helicobacter pylori Hp P-74]|nr:putative membrane protein [Helicobacter pylori Hp P-74]
MFNDFNRLILFFTAYGFCCFALFFLCLSFVFGVLNAQGFGF